MKRLIAGPLLISTALAFAAEEPKPAAPPAPAWIDFEATDGSFSISLPAQPAEKVTETPVEGKAPIVTTAYTLNMGPGGFYFVSYTDNPGLKKSKPEAAFDAVQQELAKQGTVQGQQEVSIDGFPGREISVDMTAKQPGDISSIVRVYVVGGRLYQTLTTHQKATTPVGVPRKFHDSFKLLKKP